MTEEQRDRAIEGARQLAILILAFCNDELPIRAISSGAGDVSGPALHEKDFSLRSK
jgi:hypothetical protein